MGLSPLSACNPSSVYFAGKARCNKSTVTIYSLRIFRRCSLASPVSPRHRPEA
jgi:hypothetical protein